MPQNKPIRNSQPAPRSSIWQLVLSLLGTLTFWALALAIVLIVLRTTINAPGTMGDSLALLLMAAGFTFVGFLMIPSAVLASLKLLNIPIPSLFRLPRPLHLFILFAVVLALGYLVAQHSNLVWIFLPPIHVLAIGIAVLWMISLGIRGLQTGSAQSKWGIFTMGLVAAPVLTLLIEFVVIMGVGVIGIAYLGRDPGFSAELSQLYERYLVNPNLPLDVIFESLEPYLMQPMVVYGGLFVVALLVPLIEELLKPIGVWLLAGRQPTPAQGFSAGVLSGAGFALFENLTLSATSGEEWAVVVVARIGTSIIHILTTGITGWALATAWIQKKYLRLGAAYLVAVAIHALWNGLVILSIIPVFFPDLADYPNTLENIGYAAPFGFFILLIGSFIILLRYNVVLRHAIIPPVVDPINGSAPGLDSKIPQQALEEISPGSNSEESDRIRTVEEET